MVGEEQRLIRDFELFSLDAPENERRLFSSQSPWNDYIGVVDGGAKAVPVLPDSELQCYATFELMRQASILAVAEQALGENPDHGKLRRLLREAEFDGGHIRQAGVGVTEFTFPIFEADTDGERPEIALENYAGEKTPPNPTIEATCENNDCVALNIPQPQSLVRPSEPFTDEGDESDGAVILVDRSNQIAYDFWQATVNDDSGNGQGGRVGTRVTKAGGVAAFDYSNASGLGAQPESDTPSGSSRATGLPYLGGLIIPEDFHILDLTGNEDPAGLRINHALAFTLPGMRYLGSRGVGSVGFREDYVYPASSLETSFGTVNPFALCAGQRIRLKDSIVCKNGTGIDQSKLKPVTQTFLNTLKDFGAYLVDGALGFGFAAEDHHTANVTLSPEVVSWLGTNPGEALKQPNGETAWEFLMGELTEDLFNFGFVFAASAGDGLLQTNFEVVS